MIGRGAAGVVAPLIASERKQNGSSKEEGVQVASQHEAVASRAQTIDLDRVFELR